MNRRGFLGGLAALAVGGGLPNCFEVSQQTKPIRLAPGIYEFDGTLVFQDCEFLDPKWLQYKHEWRWTASKAAA